MADVAVGGPPDPAAPSSPGAPSAGPPAPPSGGPPPAQPPNGPPAQPPNGPPDALVAGDRGLRRTGWRRWLPLAGIISLIAACTVGMLLFLGFNIGVEGLLIGLAAAILPVPVLVGCFLWLDRYEP
jgi:hypothetical protein